MPARSIPAARTLWAKNFGIVAGVEQDAAAPGLDERGESPVLAQAAGIAEGVVEEGDRRRRGMGPRAGAGKSEEQEGEGRQAHGIGSQGRTPEPSAAWLFRAGRGHHPMA